MPAGSMRASSPNRRSLEMKPIGAGPRQAVRHARRRLDDRRLFFDAAVGRRKPRPLPPVRRAMRETAQWANRNHDKSADILSKYTKLDPQLIRSGVRARFGEAGVTPEMLQSSIDLAARYKLFETAFPASELIYQPRR